MCRRTRRLNGRYETVTLMYETTEQMLNDTLGMTWKKHKEGYSDGKHYIKGKDITDSAWERMALRTKNKPSLVDLIREKCVPPLCKV